MKKNLGLSLFLVTMILIVFGIITFVISMIVNLFRIFDNLALVFIILGFGIALISYVFYKETKKNKN